MYDNEAPRAGWAEILLLAERLMPQPSLLPTAPFERALAFGLAHEICGEAGLGWARRLQLIHAGLNDSGGFHKRVASYLAKKYGYSPAAGEAASARVAALLGMLANRLKAQRALGSRYYLGQTLTAVDVYSAAVMALFAPLPHEHCEMDPATRATFDTRDAPTLAALDSILIEHRDMMYSQHLELPLSL
jgi:glutathione S-transferase